VLDNLINRAIYRLFNCTSQDNILFIRSMFNITPVSHVMQMRVSTFIDHYQHVVPFGELVVKCSSVSLTFLVFSCLFLCVTLFLFSVHFFFCLSVCAAIW